MKWVKAAAAAGLCVLSVSSQVMATSPAVTQDDFLLGRDQGRFVVTEAVSWSTPLTQAIRLPMFSGAADVTVTSVPAGAKVRAQVVLVPAHTQRLRIQYRLPLGAAGAGIATQRSWPQVIERQVVVVEPTVTFPIILNQRFYGQPSVQLAGQRVKVYATQTAIAADTSETLNLERGAGSSRPAHQGIPQTPVLAAAYGLPLIILLGYLGVRRWGHRSSSS